MMTSHSKSFFKHFLTFAAMAMLPPCSVLAKTTLYTCGDSTMANYATDGSTPTRGWGQYFGTFFSSDIDVINYGKGGMDVQNFYFNPAYWPQIKSKLQPGDFVLLQFAHNDEKHGGMDGRELKAYYERIGEIDKAAAVDLRGSVPSGSYRNTLSLLVDEIRDCGATPIFATPICRMYFSGNEIKRNGRHDLGDKFDILTIDGPTYGNKVPADDHSMDYHFQMIKLAREKNVDYIDMTEDTRQLYTSYGKDRTAQVISDGHGGTHLSVAGAALIARRAAGLMLDKNILSDYIRLGDSALNFTSDGNFGSAYVGNSLYKEFTLTGFGLTPEKGDVTISASKGFELSLDNSSWSNSITLSYEGATLIGTFHTRVVLEKKGVIKGTLNATAGENTQSLSLSAEGLAIPRKGAFSLLWSLASEEKCKVKGDAIPLEMTLMGLEAKGCNNGLLLAPAAGWPAGDIDESPTRYVEFGLKVPEGKTVIVNSISLNIAGIDTEAMQCHVSYSLDDAFGNPKTFFSPSFMKEGRTCTAATDLLLNVTQGQTLRLRIYPWTKEAMTRGAIRISDVNIKGHVATTSGLNPATTSNAD